MSPVLVLLAIALVAGWALAFWQLRKLLNPTGEPDLGRAMRFSRSAYRPMERLLDDADFLFLRAQPGYRGGMDRRLRAERKAVFRSYLRLLNRDFRALHMAARIAAAGGREDRPDLFATLLRQSIAFQWGMARVRLRLTLFDSGLDGASSSLRDLVDTAARLREALGAWTAVEPAPRTL